MSRLFRVRMCQQKNNNKFLPLLNDWENILLYLFVLFSCCVFRKSVQQSRSFLVQQWCAIEIFYISDTVPATLADSYFFEWLPGRSINETGLILFYFIHQSETGFQFFCMFAPQTKRIKAYTKPESDYPLWKPTIF